MNDVLIHYGVPGMRWGVRRKSKRTPSEDHTESRNIKKKHVSEMSNNELQRVNRRMELEQNYSRLSSRKKSAGEKFITGVIVGAATGVATAYATKYAKKGAAYLEKAIANKIAKK